MDVITKFGLLIGGVCVGLALTAYVANLLAYLITKGIMNAREDAKKEQKEKEDG